MSIDHIYCSCCCCVHTSVIFPLHPFMKHTLKTDDIVDQFPSSSLTNHIYPGSRQKLGLNMLLYNWAKHRLRGVIVHSELTDLLCRVLIGCKTNHLMKQASRGSLGCQHTAPVTQQPIRAQSPCRRRSDCLLPSLDVDGWIFHTYIYRAAPLV